MNILQLCHGAVRVFQQLPFRLVSDDDAYRKTIRVDAMGPNLWMCAAQMSTYGIEVVFVRQELEASVRRRPDTVFGNV